MKIPQPAPFSPTPLVRNLRKMNHQHAISAYNALIGVGIVPPTNKGYAFLLANLSIYGDGCPRNASTLRQALKFILNPRF